LQGRIRRPDARRHPRQHHDHLVDEYSSLAFLAVSVSLALAAQDKYSAKVPGGLAFSEFRGYEDWQIVGPSLTDAQNVIRVIVANPVGCYGVMITRWTSLAAHRDSTTPPIIERSMESSSRQNAESTRMRVTTKS